MKKQLAKTAVFALIISFCFTSCLPGLGDDDTTSDSTNAELIEGEWNITSLKLNGNEVMGSSFSSLSMDFGPLIDGKGIVKFEFVSAFNGEEDSSTEQYRVNEINNEVILGEGSFDDEVHKLEFQGDNQLTMNSRSGSGDTEIFQTIQAVRISN